MAVETPLIRQTGSGCADLLHQMPALAWTVDLELRITRRAGAVFGDLADLPTSLYEALGSRDPALAPIAAHVRALGGATASYEWTWGGRTLACQVAPLVDDDGRIIGAVGAALDISDRKAQEVGLTRQRDDAEDLVRQLRESEGRSRTLLSSLPQRIFFKDPEGRFVQVNELFAADFGGSPEGMAGKTDFDLFPADLAEKYRADDLRIMASGETETLIESNVSGGALRVVEVVKKPVVSSTGESLGILGVFTDVTERVRAEQELKKTAAELQRSNEDLQQFAYVASHDLQEPLRMVASYTQLLARRYRDRLDDDANDFIQYAVDGAVRMQRLINDLLQYSRVGTQGIAFQAVPLQEPLKRALSNLEAAIQESGARITHDPLPVVEADPAQMTQLFQNLIGNAVKFRGPQPPEVHIACERAADEWVLSVRDNGIGIDPQYAERVFVIFQRLHNEGTYSGSGIGLSICKKIVSRHGGRIWVESAQAEGTCFRFSLRAEAQPAQESPAAAKE